MKTGRQLPARALSRAVADQFQFPRLSMEARNGTQQRGVVLGSFESGQ
jgi:hypothetical protein